jgi:hypothetical protein
VLSHVLLHYQVRSHLHLHRDLQLLHPPYFPIDILIFHFNKVVNPIEVIKIRLQLQGELANERNQSSLSRIYGSQRTYRGTFRGILHIIQEESIAGLYKGLVPPLLLFLLLLNRTNPFPSRYVSCCFTLPPFHSFASLHFSHRVLERDIV